MDNILVHHIIEDNTTIQDIENSKVLTDSTINTTNTLSNNQINLPVEEKTLEIPISEHKIIRTQQELDEVIKNHQIWLDSVLNPLKKIAGGRANLTGSNLSGLNLKGVNLSGATLKNVNFENADLSGANLTAADLRYANFNGANLSRTIFKKATLDYAIFTNTNITEEQLQSAKSYNKIQR